MKKLSSGKVRDIYDIGNDRLVIVTTDRISAFDCILPSEIPGKGVVLNKMSAFWFNFTKDIVSNHMISTDIDDFPVDFQSDAFNERSMLVDRLDMFPVECIVRGYITGSGWESYKKSKSVCGISLRDGLLESEKLDEPIFTPTTKATDGHDQHITLEEMSSLIGCDYAKKLQDISISVYKKASEYALRKGIIIADTKFEFGRNKSGEIILADEVLTPDSSRFWSVEDYAVGRSQKSFDKQYVRDYLSNSGWNKQPPAPEIPNDVITRTADKYNLAYSFLTFDKS